MEPAVFAERASSIQRHLERVCARLPDDPADFRPMSDATDTVILHLWQAVQITIDLATSMCVGRGLGVPPTYGDSFRLLAADGLIVSDLAERLARAAGFRNLVVHAYADLDLLRVHHAARTGPNDLLQFLSQLRDSAFSL